MSVYRRWCVIGKSVFEAKILRKQSSVTENERPWVALSSGLSLAVRLTPKGGRDGIDGIETLSDGRVVLKARVRAAPMEGEANDAVCRLIAKALGVAPRDVLLSAGASARIKRLTIKGDAATLIERLKKMAE